MGKPDQPFDEGWHIREGCNRVQPQGDNRQGRLKMAHQEERDVAEQEINNNSVLCP